MNSEKNEGSTLSLTIFKNKYDTNTAKRMDFSSFDELEKLFYALSKINLPSKESAKLISPATYHEGTTRKNANVVDWGGWACIDVDDWKIEGDVKDAVFAKFGKYRFVCYSTASSTRELPKFRVVFALTRRVMADQIRPLWFALSEMADRVVDKQVKDLSRMYYIPGNYTTSRDSFQFIFSNPDGEFIDPDLLIQQYPAPVKESTNLFDRLPEEVQKKIIEHRKESMTNRSYSWNSYRTCPFWPKKLEKEYREITNTGWYHKMYQIMVAIAGRAIEKKYPITPTEIAQLCHEFDAETGGWYKNRSFDKEAERALEFVYRGM